MEWRLILIFKNTIQMKLRVLYILLTVFTLGISVSSCLSDDDVTAGINQSTVVSINFKANGVKEFKELELEFTEINTGLVTKEKAVGVSFYSIALPTGAYRMSVEGAAFLEDGEEIRVGGVNDKLDASGQVLNLVVDLRVKQFSKDFIFEEIFFTGVKTLEGKAYNSGQYFKIVNNTDEVLYADGLLICKSEFLTTTDNNETPNVFDSAFPVDGVLMLPGKGKDYPVEPGDFIVVADNAQNHRTANIPGPDLTNADFEFPIVESPAINQPDNPNVPNAIVVYTNMKYSMFIMHNRGYKGHVLARLPKGESVESWLANHKYDYSYVNATGKETKKSAYKIPNAWIVDGVNSSIVPKFQRLVMGASLDSGFSYCGSSESDDSRFGKAIRRKSLGENTAGRNVYKDTNNSTVDFIPDSPASLLNGISHK